MENPKDYERLLDFVFFESPFIPQAIIQHFSQKAIINQPLHSRIFKQLASDMGTVSLERLLGHSQTPTLVVWGDKDRVLHVSGAKILESNMPDAQIRVMKKVGHLPMLEKPEASAKAFMVFLDQTFH